MKPELVRFSRHPSPFRVEITQCANMDCDCTEVAFTVREVARNGQDAAEAMAFQVRVEGQTWEEIEPPPRSAEVAALVQELLRDYPLSERDSIRRLVQEKVRIARRLRNYRIEQKQVEDGELVAFGEIAYERAGGIAESASFFGSFEHAGERYFVDDMYCPNPECHCDEVHLLFVRRVAPRQPGASAASEHEFLARLSLDGRVEIVDRKRGTPSEATAVLSTWQEQCGYDLEELRWRYEKVKEIARRSLPSRTVRSPPKDLPPKTPAVASVRIGRNDPCPCGSGIKFKKCCGQPH